MEYTEVSSARTGDGTLEAQHYNGVVKLFSPDPAIVSKLLKEVGAGPSSSVADATPMPNDVAQRLNALLDGTTSPRRVGPTIDSHREWVECGGHFMLDNFFGLPAQSRHTNPNKIVINVGNSSVVVDVAVLRRLACSSHSSPTSACSPSAPWAW